MLTDTLDRRVRFAKPQPRQKRITIHTADLYVFEALQRHGPLPTHYLYEFVKHTTKNRNAFQHRLTKLYNGTHQSPPFLDRPPQQFACVDARFQHVIYDLTKLSRTLLGEHGRLDRFAPLRSDHFLHRFMGACVSASIELAAVKAGFQFISKEEIFSRAPDRAKRSANPLAIGLSTRKLLVPDDLFGLRYPDKKVRFFVVEIDRATESIERTSRLQNAFARKLDGYLDIFTNRTFHEHWGIPNVMLMTVTTNATHLENIVNHLRKRSIPAERFLFMSKPIFGSNWKVPALMPDLVAAPWKRVNDEFCILD